MKRSLFGVLLAMLAVLVGCQSQQSTQGDAELHTLGMRGVDKTQQVTLVDESSGASSLVTVGVLDGKLIYQGEYLSNKITGDVGSQAAIVTTRKWPGNTVPYTISASATSTTRSQIQQAVDYYNANTNLRWVARTSQTDYVEFFNGSGCWSYVGRIGGKQQISLGSNGCGVGGALHEMGHALGFHHEQSRPDRDTYVRIRYDLIPSNIAYNWDIASESRGYGNYDYYSIMHYGLYYNGQKVIEVLQPGIDETRIGRGTTLTPTDISAVNYLYSTTTPPPPTSSQTYTGSLSTPGTSIYHPGTTGFSYTGGTLKGTLSGPSNADFDLYLQKQTSTGWSTVGRSESTSSSENISYSAAAGTYRWRVYDYSGSGSYTLTTQK